MRASAQQRMKDLEDELKSAISSETVLGGHKQNGCGRGGNRDRDMALSEANYRGEGDEGPCISAFRAYDRWMLSCV
jgi:hypothetical protein